MLSAEYFQSKACIDELKQMHKMDKTIIPVKLAAFPAPKSSLDRMLPNHIPGTDSGSSTTFQTNFATNIQLLANALRDAGV